MNLKEEYSAFCAKTYVPIYSKPWWMDAICGAENWDVWLYEQGGEVVAAMPYYLEQRKAGLYITKAPLTQNNGIIFRHPANARSISRSKFEEKIIDEACRFIAGLGLAVYEQQFHPSFKNWLPFSWNGYSALPRYTFTIDDLSDIEAVWQSFSSSYRNHVKKGQRNAVVLENLESDAFFDQHALVFQRQGLALPFSRELWQRLHKAAESQGACKILYAQADDGGVASVLFLVWDEKTVYHLLGGTMPEYQGLESYNTLTWEGLKLAHDKGLSYDFEGSMIKRIGRSFREFGGEPKLYFRIRKVFDPQVISAEADQQIARLEHDGV